MIVSMATGVLCVGAKQQNSKRLSAVNGNSQSESGIPSSHSAEQLSSGGQIAQGRRDKINYQYLMMAIPQSDEKKRFSLGQKSASGSCNDQQQFDSFLQDSWATDKPSHPTPQRQLSSVTIDPGDLAADSKSLKKGGSHDYQNVSFDDEELADLILPDSRSLRLSRSVDTTMLTGNSNSQSTLKSSDPFLCDSWAAQSSNTIATSNPSKMIPIATDSVKPLAQSLPDYENVQFSDVVNGDDDDDDDDCSQPAPLQIDFGDLIEAIDDKKKKKKQEPSDSNQQSNADHQQSNIDQFSAQNDSSNNDNYNDDDYHDYPKGPIKLQSQPIQRSNSIILSSGSHVDPVSGDPDYENYGSEEDYANVFDTPLTPANKKNSGAYDKLELKPKKSSTLSGHSFSLTGSHDATENGSHDEESQKLIENNDNPFAGLVMTASSMMSSNSCHGDLTRSMARSVIRRSNASCLGDNNRQSLWSSDRVEQEFDQVSTVDNDSRPFFYQISSFPDTLVKVFGSFQTALCTNRE